MITEENSSITILAFNYGLAGRTVNGPGICLFNFVKILKRVFPKLSINLFTQLQAHQSGIFSNTYNIKNKKLLKECIESSQVVHHWSGIGDAYSDAITFANYLNKFVIIGPNVIDTVNFDEEKRFLSKVKFNRLLTVNKRLLFKISRDHNIASNFIKIFMIGPDSELWYPSDNNNGKILWKGNSKQFVKDVSFGLKVASKLGRYSFDFLGYPEPYDYFDHIKYARNYKLYFCTSLSETMGMSLAEQWACGIPSVTHPNIYLHGNNYETGIITNRNVDDYCDAISEIMEDESLYRRLSNGCIKFIKESFSDSLIVENYLNFINN